MRVLVSILFLLVSSIKCTAKTITNPFFDRSDTQSLRIEKIKVTDDTTYIYCSFSVIGGYWVNIAKEMYLYDSESDKKYNLIQSHGLPISPQDLYIEKDECRKVILCFPPIAHISKFDLIEYENEKAKNIYGIDLTQCYKTKYQESDIKEFSELSSSYDYEGDSTKALHYKNKEIEAIQYVYGVKSEPLLMPLLSASNMYEKYGNYQAAVELIKQEGVIMAELWGNSNWYYALHLRTLATIYSNAQNYEMSIKTYKEAIDLFERIDKTDREYALALRLIAMDYYNIGDNTNALYYEKKCVETRRLLRFDSDYINELYNLLLMGVNQDMAKRIEIVQEELNSLPDFVDKNSPDFISIYEQIASMYSCLDNNKEAIFYCDKAISIYNHNGKKEIELYADLLGLKCKYQQRSGLIDDAIVSGLWAKQLLDSLNIKSIKYADLLFDLAWVYGHNFNYEKSIILCETAAGIYEKAKDWISLAETYMSICNYYQQAEDLSNAEKFVIKTTEVLNLHDDAEVIIKENAELLGNSLIANPFNITTLQSRIYVDKAGAYQELAKIYQKEGKIKEAIISQRKCSEIYKDMGKNGGYALSLLMLSSYYLIDKQYTNAINCIEQSIQIAYNENDSLQQTLAAYTLAQIHKEKGNVEEAIRYAEQAVTNSKKNHYWVWQLNTQALLSRFYEEKGDYINAELIMSEVLNCLQDTIRCKIKEMTTEQKQRMWDVYEPLFFSYRQIIEKSDKNSALISKLCDFILFSKSLLLESEIRDDDKRLSRLLINWKSIQQKLSNQDIAIEFIYMPEDSVHFTYYALVVDSNCDYPNMITLYNESYFEKIRQTSTKPVIDILGDLIWQKIISKYENIKNIYFSPEGIINIMPIEYCNVEGIGEMMEHYNLFRLSSTKEIVFTNKKETNNKAVLYGGLDYDILANESNNDKDDKKYSFLRSINARGGFDPLSSTQEEVKEISSILNGKNVIATLYTGENGTEDSFKDLSGKDVNMLHLSTHGMYVSPSNVSQKKNENNYDFLKLIQNEKDPVKEDIVLTHSFLVMSGGNSLSHHKQPGSGKNDGILTAFEISHVDLRNVDIVVLSACETGLGDIGSGGIYGLQRGFKKAGVKTILMSLDMVDDEATKILMVEFYRNLMDGKTKLESLKEAQKHLRKVDNGKYDKPEYWASFIMLDGFN